MSNGQYTAAIQKPEVFRKNFLDKLLLGKSWSEYARSLATPLNVIAVIILVAAAPVFYSRYVHGLSTVLDASPYYPWGLLLSWGIFAGEPLFASGFVVAAAYYVFGFKSYKPLVRLAVLGGMLGYAFAASYLLIDLGRPWRLYYPMLINFGPSSILFIVAWHVSLYTTVQVLEFSPTILEWLGARKLHKWAVSGTVGLIIIGIVLSTVHQSALGAMYLITPGKLHPLWYSANLPLLFMSSAVYAAMSFAIVLAFVGLRYFREHADNNFINSVKPLTLSLGKGAALAMYVYFALKMITLGQSNDWALLNTPYGHWYLLEVGGFVLFPALIFTMGVKYEVLGAIRLAAFLAIAGILLNRVNVNLIAYNWQLPDHLHHIIPPMTELKMIAAMVTLHILTFRWILNRMPVMRDEPGYKH